MSGVRRLLRGLPEALRGELAEVMQDTGTELLRDMQAQTPIGPTGRLRRGLRMVLTPKLLRLRVGLVGKPANRKLFYARILNFGRKAQTVTVRKAGRVGKSTDARGRPYYLMKVRAIAPKRFIVRPRPELWKRFDARLKARWAQVLRRAAGG